MKYHRLIALLLIYVFSIPAFSQEASGDGATVSVNILKVLATADDVARTAELIAITADVIDNTIATGDKITAIKRDIKEMNQILNSPEFGKFCSDDTRKRLLDEVSYTARTVELYAVFLGSTIKILKGLKTSLNDLKDKEGAQTAVGDAIKGAVSSTMGAVSKIPIWGGLIDGVAGIFGAGSDDKATKPVVDAIKQQEQTLKKESFEERLVQFLYDLERYNENLDRVRDKVRGLKYTLSSRITIGMMASLPYSTVRDYAYKRGITLKK
jgi:hypothetical protein